MPVASYNQLPMYKYFTAMSEALALECGGDRAYVTTPDVDKIPTDGIWALVEYPTLTREDAVPPQKVEKVICFTNIGLEVESNQSADYCSFSP